mmetsp:Transcript_24465/g.37942  ORF Transcript_24465/g.37942 Transcript_24465/m.37942 type:complete len:416 (-) Transcript_24465:782-2029(-)
MDVVVNGLSGNFGGGSEEAANVDIVAEIGEAGGNNLGSSVVTILAHLSDKDSGVSALSLSEVLNVGEGGLVLVLTLVTGVLEGLLRVGTSHNRIGGDMASADLLDGVGDLTNSGSELSSLDSESKEVALATSGGSDSVEAILDGLVVSVGLHGLDTLDLLSSDIVVVDLEHVEVLLLVLELVLVNTNLNLGAGVELSLATSSTLLNSHLGHAGDDGLGHTAEFLDLIDNLTGLLDEVVGEGLHHVAATPGVNDVGDSSLLLDNELSVSGNASRELSGQSNSLVEGVGVQGLGSTEDGGHGLDSSSHDVVVGILLGQRPSGSLAMSSQSHALSVLGTELLLDKGGPQLSGSSELGDLRVEVHTNSEEEGEPGSDLVDVQTSLLSSSDVLKTIGDSERKLQLRVSTGLLHVVPGDRN